MQKCDSPMILFFIPYFSACLSSVHNALSLHLVYRREGCKLKILFECFLYPSLGIFTCEWFGRFWTMQIIRCSFRGHDTSVFYSTLNYILSLRHQASFTDCQLFYYEGLAKVKFRCKGNSCVYVCGLFCDHFSHTNYDVLFFLRRKMWQCEWFLLWRRFHADAITFKFIGTAHVREKALDDAHYGNNKRKWR